MHATTCWLNEPEHAAAHCCFPAAAFTDDSQRATLGNRKADPVHRLHSPNHSSQESLAGGEVHLKRIDYEQWLGIGWDHQLPPFCSAWV